MKEINFYQDEKKAKIGYLYVEKISFSKRQVVV